MQERPNNIHFRDTLAWVLYRKHDYRQARDALRPMEDSMSRYPTVAYHYALALLKLKQNEEARRFLKLAVTNAKPNSSWLNTANGLLEDMERQTPGGK